MIQLSIFVSAAARTKNYSDGELEGVVKSAASYALNRLLSRHDLTKPVDAESIKVTMDDFLNALHNIIPAFGASTDDLERYRYSFEQFEDAFSFQILFIYFIFNSHHIVMLEISLPFEILIILT